jgi:putative intracellular protease/amidase
VLHIGASSGTPQIAVDGRTTLRHGRRMKQRILVVVTSCEKFPGENRPTGLWLGEAVHFVDGVLAAGHAVDYASPRGGYTPIDPSSLAQADALDWRYYGDKKFMNQLGATRAAAAVDPREYGVIYYAGGHGVVFDFPDNAALAAISRDIYARGGIVASVCHGACALLAIPGPDGTPLIQGKEVTGFSNQEEKLAGLDAHLPFLTEDALTQRGALYRKAAQPFTPFAVASERVVTGQNPQSGHAVAQRVLALL